MFVPDDAKKRRILDGLTSATWLVYEAHCYRRYNHRHETERFRGLSFATNEEVAKIEGLALQTVRNAMVELRKKGWLRDEQVGVRLLVGDFSPVDRRRGEGSTGTGTGAHAPVTDSTHTSTSNTCVGTPHTGTGTGAYIGTRARSLQPPPASSSNEITHTHDTQPAREAADGEGVCVSDLRFEDYRDFARSTPTFTKPDAWAMKHFPLRDADLLVREWKERRAQVLAGRAPVERKLMPFPAAAQMVHSQKQRGSDAATLAVYIENELGDKVSDYDREQLLERFVRAPAPHGREGAA
jgi:hypothetical protein